MHKLCAKEKLLNGTNQFQQCHNKNEKGYWTDTELSPGWIQHELLDLEAHVHTSYLKKSKPQISSGALCVEKKWE